MKNSYKDFVTILLVVVLVIIIGAAVTWFILSKPSTPASSVVSPTNISSIPTNNSPVAEKQAYYDELLTHPSRDLWSRWNDALSRKNPYEISSLVAALGYRLRSDSDTSVYSEMASRLAQSSRTAEDRVAIIDGLMFAATPDAEKILLNFLHDTNAQPKPNRNSYEEQVQRWAEETVLSIARTLVDGSRNWAVSPVLENAWRMETGSYSPQTVSVLAQSIASLGKPTGVTALIDVAGKTNPSDPRHNAALSAIQSLQYNNDPVDVIASALKQYSGNKELARALIIGLLSIGTDDAAGVLANNTSWISKSYPDLMPQVESLLTTKERIKNKN